MKKKSKQESGAVMAEAVISIMFFMSLLMFTTDLIRLGLAATGNQLLAIQMARKLSVEFPVETPDRLERIKITTYNRARSFGLPVNGQFRVRVCESGEADCSEEGTGGPGDLLTLSVSFPFKILLGHVEIPVRAVAIARNEYS